MDCEISKALRPARPYLAVGLEAIYHHFPLSLILPEVSEELFLLRMVLTNSFQAPFDPAIYIVWIEGQPEVEDLSVVTVVVAECRPTREAFVSSPTGYAAADHGYRIPATFDGILGR